MDITAVLSIIITILGTVITSFLLPMIKSKMDKEQREELGYWVQAAVGAAEQLLGSGEGVAKKAYVIDFLAHKGYTFDEKTIETLLEANVNRLGKQISQ